MSSREKGQADFDLERFIDMFDEALTSNDERVINALRSLMMMVVLTKPEVRHEGHDMNHGPLRQLFEDMHNLSRRMHNMEEIMRDIKNSSMRETYRSQYETHKWTGIPSQWDVKSYEYDQDVMKRLAQQINQPLTKKGNI